MTIRQNFVPSCLIPEVYGPWKLDAGFIPAQIERMAGEGFYRAVEIGRIPGKQDRSSVRQICQEHGIKVVSWMTDIIDEHQLDLSSTDEALRQRSVEVIKAHLPGAIACGSTTVSFIGGRDPGPENRERGYDSCYRSLMAICAEAANLGASVMFEPLDRFAHKKRLVSLTDEAVALFARVRMEYPDFGFAFDTAHAALNEEDIGSSLALAKDQIANMHLSNAVLDKRDALYGDHHIMPGAPGFLTIDCAAGIIASMARLGIGRNQPVRIAIEARAQLAQGPAETAGVATAFLKLALEQAESRSS